MSIFEKLMAILKLPCRMIFVIALILGLVLFLPESLLIKLQLTDFISEYGKYVGIVFLISSSYLGVSLVIYLYNIFIQKKHNKTVKKNMVQILNSLSLSEIYLLREFFIQRKDVIMVPYENTEFISLYNKKILLLASDKAVGYVFGIFVTVTINPAIKNYITADILKFPEGQVTQKEKEEICKHRPDYLSTLEYINHLIKNITQL